MIAAETGSGKTHSYLVPLLNKLSDQQDNVESTKSDQLKGYQCGHSLVLCPNVLLCEQVVRMANGLSGDNGEPLVRAVAVCGRQVLMLLLIFILLRPL